MMVCRARLLLLALVCFGIPLGALAQGGSVLEATGEASYRIPIVVPPGPAGHQPELALVYASGNGRGPAGWLGFGWSLAGESRIERETRTAGPFDFDARSCGAGGAFACYRSDYVLDGQDLICDSGACEPCSASAPCRYRTQSDDGRIIEFMGESSGWTIADRDGRVFVYGASSSGATRLANPTLPPFEVASWLLERSTDVSGNEIRYGYDTSSSENVAYLARIEYGAGSAANRSIEFVLNDPLSAPRPDRPVWARAGFRQQVDRRVAAIEVRAASNQLVTTYRLAYTQDPDSTRSRLASVQRIGADARAALPPYTFSYSERLAGDGFEQVNQPGYFGAPAQCPPLGGLHADPSGNGFWNIADLNRDGLDDLYFVQGYSEVSTSGRTEVALGTGTRFLPGSGLACGYALARGNRWSGDRLFFASTLSVPTLQISRAATLDLDGDGFLDHIDHGGSYRAGSFEPVAAGVRLGGPNGFSDATLPTSLELAHLWDFSFGNGWNADDFWIRIASTTNGSSDTRALLADVTGDGRPDLLATRGTTPFDYWDGASWSPVWPDWTGWAVFANRGLATGAGGQGYLDFGDGPLLWPAPPGVGIETVSFGLTSRALADQNGDGLPDQLTRSSVAYGYGAGFLPAEPVADVIPQALIAAPLYVRAGLYDLNGDGFLDHVSAQNEGADPYWHVHFGTGHGFNPSESLFRRVVDVLDEVAIEADGITVGARSIRDVNGDGRPDYVAAGRGSVFLQSRAANHDGERSEPLAGLLTRAADPLGGSVELHYAMSAQLQTESGLPANPEMVLRRPVVTRVTRRDGRAGTPAIVSELWYGGGVFDYAEKEFRGFASVIETELEQGVDPTRISSSYRTDRVCASSLASREVARGESVMERESLDYLQVLGGGVSDAQRWGRCLLATRTEEAVEGSEADRRMRRTVWNYGDPIDASYNVARLEEWGEWNPATGQDVPGDERITELGYAAASEAFPAIVSRVNSQVVKDAAGNVYSKRQYCHSGASGCSSAGNGKPEVVVAFLTDYFASPPIIDAPRTVTTISYDAWGNPAQLTGAATPDDPDGLRTEIDYDPTYRTFPTEIRRGADVAAPLRPLATRIDYAGCPSGLAPPPGLGLPCSVRSPTGGVELLGYDDLGRVARLERPATGYVQTRSYALPGASSPGENVLETRVHRAGAADLVEREVLDGLARVRRHESPGALGETVFVERSFDDRGRLRTESLPRVGGPALVRAYSYDALDRVALVLDPDASTHHITSYAPWTVIDETHFGAPSPANRVERTERASDGLGRIVRVANHPDAAGLSSPHAVTARYDAADRLYQLLDPIASDPSLCASLEMGPRCATQDHVTEIFWDSFGRRVRIDDPDSGVWRFEYDDEGRLLSRTQNDGSSNSRAELRSYDPLGRLASTRFVPSGAGVSDASFVYGNDDSSPDFARLVGVIGASPEGTTHLYGYDAAGRRSRVLQRTAGLEFDSAFEYDELDRVRRRTYPDGEAIDYVYDGLRLREIRADAANPVFTGAVLRNADYDALGRASSLEIGAGPGGAALVTETYAYDPATARLSGIGASVGSPVSDDPDGDRVPVSGDICPNAWDPAQLDRGGLGEGSGPDGIGDGCQCGDVDGTGQVTLSDAFAILMFGFGDETLSRPDLCDVDESGSCDPYDFVAVLLAAWNGSGDLQGCRATKPLNLPSSSPIDLELAFDGLGRLVAQTGWLGAESVSRSYAYDGLSRLSSATGPWEKARGRQEPVTWTWRYDALGNPRAQASSLPESWGGDHRTWVYQHASKPRFLSEFVAAGELWEAIFATEGGEPARIDLGAGYGTETFAWNARGKLHRYGGSSYEYDAFGDLARTAIGSGARATSIIHVAGDFEYDVAARRASKYFSVGGVRIASLATSWVAPAASAPIASLLASGIAALPPAAASATPSSGPGSHGRHAEPILAHLTDHLGSVIGSVNRDGVVVETRDYAPFGESIAQLGSFAVGQRFTGQPQDDAAESLYNYGARFYEPRWGRFISPDEVVQSFDSQGLNPYSYVLNRPTSLVDPSGRFAGVSAPYGNTIALLGGCNPTYTTVRDPSSAQRDTEVRSDVWNTPLADMVAEMRLADAAFPPVPMVLNLTRILLVDFHAFTLGTFSQLVINPFMSLGKLIDRTLNGDLRGMGDASQWLIEGTLVPRYALQNGPYWGRGQTSNDKLDSVLEEAGFEHDDLCAGGCTSDADRTWIRIAWSDPWRLGPYGQAYRLAGTAAFSARIAWRSMTGQP